VRSRAKSQPTREQGEPRRAKFLKDTGTPCSGKGEKLCNWVQGKKRGGRKKRKGEADQQPRSLCFRKNPKGGLGLNGSGGKPKRNIGKKVRRSNQVGRDLEGEEKGKTETGLMKIRIRPKEAEPFIWGDRWSRGRRLGANRAKNTKAHFGGSRKLKMGRGSLKSVGWQQAPVNQ